MKRIMQQFEDKLITCEEANISLAPLGYQLSDRYEAGNYFLYPLGV